MAAHLFGVKNAEIDLSITRGLAYYTGLVFEFKLLNYPELGTAAGGGRYADLAGKFSKTKIIGVGAAIGFSRIFVALMRWAEARWQARWLLVLLYYLRTVIFYI